jgi:hypothetical protein
MADGCIVDALRQTLVFMRKILTLIEKQKFPGVEAKNLLLEGRD